MIEVHQADPEEFSEAGRITALAYREFISPELDWTTYLERVADIASRATIASVYVATEDNHLLGSVTLELTEHIPGTDPNATPLQPDEAHIRMLGVDPSARRRGVARILMEYCIEVAKASGKSELTLHTGAKNVAAQTLYEAMGFVRGPNITRTGGELLTYHLALDIKA